MFIKLISAVGKANRDCVLFVVCSKLKSEWEERVKVIGDLENSLTQVQDTFSQREAVLVKEKEELLVRVKSVEERLRECEDTHSRQVEEQKRSHDSHMTQLTQEKDIEIEKANRKVHVNYIHKSYTRVWPCMG